MLILTLAAQLLLGSSPYRMAFSSDVHERAALLGITKAPSYQALPPPTPPTPHLAGYSHLRVSFAILLDLLLQKGLQ